MALNITLTDAKAALRTKERRQNPLYERVDNEPADPSYINHTQRRKTRLAEPSFKISRIPNPLVECGCNCCPDIADPLAGDSPFRDTYAATVCDSPRPLTLERARTVYLKYKRKEMNRSDMTSPLDRLRGLYGNVLDAERQLMDEMESPSLIFLSLRQSPIREQNGEREWIKPLRLCSELNKPWSNVRRTLQRKLSGFPRWEYVTVTGYTRSAGTPHMHVLVYVEDKSDDLSIDVVDSAVDSYVRGNDYASKKHHPVVDGESDAGIVVHSVPRKDDHIPDSSYKKALEYRDYQSFAPTSNFLLYMLSQLPHWVLSHIWDSNSNIHDDSTLVDGAVISWASTYDDFSSSRGFPT